MAKKEATTKVRLSGIVAESPELRISFNGDPTTVYPVTDETVEVPDQFIDTFLRLFEGSVVEAGSTGSPGQEITE